MNKKKTKKTVSRKKTTKPQPSAHAEIAQYIENLQQLHRLQGAILNQMQKKLTRLKK